MSDNWENQQNEQSSETTSALKLANNASLLPGNRPIEPRHLQIAETYTSVGSLRPIAKSSLEIKEMITYSGNRPIIKSGLDIKGMLTLSGPRPITSNHLKISQEFKIMGNRPVASNQIDDVLLLMGYLD